MADIIREDIIKVSFDVNWSGLNDANSELDKLKKTVTGGVDNAINKMATGANKLKKSVAGIGSNSGLDELKRDAQAGADAIGEANKETKTLKSSIGKTAKEFKSFSQTKFNNIKNNLSKIKTELTGGESGAKGFKNALKKVGSVSTSKVKTGIEKLKTGLSTGTAKAGLFVAALAKMNNQSLSSLNGKIDNIVRKLGTGIVAAAKKAIAAIAGIATAIGGLGAIGVNYNSQMQTYTTSFEVMTGSAKKAASITNKLQKMGASTPFEMTDLAETTQLLMNYGLTADDAMSRMSMLGDISQGNADKMNRIAMAYGQMSSAGKVQLEDVKQMIDYCHAA